ncbi:hypothetical protein ACFQU7_12295 [Pseudoroseomonas wenyumeiae]
MRQSPDGMAPTSNGTPRIIDNRDGQPVIQYSGPRGAGVQDGGTPRIIDNRDGQPVISYGGQVPGDTNSTNSSAMQEAASQNRARPGMRGTPAANASNAAVASQVRPLLNNARTSLQRGRYAAAASSLEQAETHAEQRRRSRRHAPHQRGPRRRPARRPQQRPATPGQRDALSGPAGLTRPGAATQAPERQMRGRGGLRPVSCRGLAPGAHGRYRKGTAFRWIPLPVPDPSTPSATSPRTCGSTCG